jgi:hypothetical protein
MAEEGKTKAGTRESACPSDCSFSLGFRSSLWTNASINLDGGNKPPVPPIGLVSGRAVAAAARAQTHDRRRVKVAAAMSNSGQGRGGSKVSRSYLVLCEF